MICPHLSLKLLSNYSVGPEVVFFFYSDPSRFASIISRLQNLPYELIEFYDYGNNHFLFTRFNKHLSVCLTIVKDIYQAKCLFFSSIFLFIMFPTSKSLVSHLLWCYRSWSFLFFSLPAFNRVLFCTGNYWTPLLKYLMINFCWILISMYKRWKKILDNILNEKNSNQGSKRYR